MTLYSRSLQLNHFVLLKLYTHPTATLLSPSLAKMHICIPWGVLKITMPGLHSQRFWLSWSGYGLPGECAVSLPAALTKHISCMLPIDHSVPAALAFVLFLENIQPVPTPGPLLPLFPLPRCPFLTCSPAEFLPAQGSPPLWWPSSLPAFSSSMVLGT